MKISVWTMIFVVVLPSFVDGNTSADTPDREGRVYHSRSLAQWHERMMCIDPRSSNALSIIDPLVEIVADKSLPGVDRRMFADYLARVGHPARRVVKVLESMIEQRHMDSEANYVWAARSLAIMGKPGAEATPTLVKLLDDHSIPVSRRQAAVEALALIGGAHPDAIPALVRLLQLRDSDRLLKADASALRQLAASSFSIVGPGGELAAPLLVRMIRDPSEPEMTRLNCINALGAMSSAGAMATNVLAEELVASQSPTLRDAAANALVKSGSSDTISRLLSHADPEVRWRMASSLRTSPQQDGIIRAGLHKLLNDRNAVVRISAAESAHKIFGRSPTIGDTAVSLLEDTNRSIRLRAKRLIIESQPLRPQANDRLQELLRHKNKAIARVARATVDQLATE